MGLPQVISRNQIQKTNKRVLPFTQDNTQPTTWYTCPANKIAIIKGQCVCTDTGAAATADLDVAGISIAEWQASGGGTDPNLPQDLIKDFLYQFDIQLDSGETLVTSQSSGSNANFKLGAVIEEFIK